MILIKMRHGGWIAICEHKIAGVAGKDSVSKQSSSELIHVMFNWIHR